MSLVDWDAPLESLASKLYAGAVNVLLSRARLWMPELAGVDQARTLSLASTVRLSRDRGFEVDAQGKIFGAAMGRMFSSAPANPPYELRGVDSDGAVWRVRDNRLQFSGDFVTGGGTYRLSPNYITAELRGPSLALVGSVELLVEADARLPDSEANLDSGAQIVSQAVV